MSQNQKNDQITLKDEISKTLINIKLINNLKQIL